MRTFLIFLALMVSEVGLSHEFLTFRAGGLILTQTDGDSYSGSIGVAPLISITDSIGIRVVGQGAMVQGKLENQELYLMADALASLQVSSLRVEAGAGIRHFLNLGGMRYNVSLGAVVPIIPMLDVYGSYAAIFVPNNLTHELNLGVDFKI